MSKPVKYVVQRTITKAIHIAYFHIYNLSYTNQDHILLTFPLITSFHLCTMRSQKSRSSKDKLYLILTHMFVSRTWTTTTTNHSIWTSCGCEVLVFLKPVTKLNLKHAATSGVQQMTLNPWHNPKKRTVILHLRGLPLWMCLLCLCVSLHLLNFMSTLFIYSMSIKKHYRIIVCFLQQLSARQTSCTGNVAQQEAVPAVQYITVNKPYKHEKSTCFLVIESLYLNCPKTLTFTEVL